MAKIRVLIVDDSQLIQQLFSQMIGSDPAFEVLGVASDPYEAREKIKLLNPDVITLDVEMPRMDGISFLEKIMTLRPMPVVMVSTLTVKGADITLRALELGAVDYIAKPTGGLDNTLPQLREELLAKLKQAAVSRIRPLTPQGAAPKATAVQFQGNVNDWLIAIGASTGGVEALREVLTRLPSPMPPIVITQHMPELFTQSFASRLNALCKLEICEAANHQRIEPGGVYIAPGGIHLEIKDVQGRFVCKLQDGPLVSGHKPSVDVLFTSVAEIAGPHAVGVILTGMGKDGAEGLLRMRQAGAATLGQSEASCIVYGMPKAAKALGAVEQEASLDAMPDAIIRLCNRHAPVRRAAHS